MPWLLSADGEHVDNTNWLAALSALGGAVAGVMGAIFARGHAEGVVIAKLDSVDEKLKLVCDELARRITVLENRYQYDGLYLQPRPGRDRE